MSVSQFSTFDIAKEIMFGDLLGTEPATRFFQNTRQDMMLAMAGAMPGKFSVFNDDFLVDTINLDNYLLSTGATATAFAHLAGPGGLISGNAGTTAATSGHSLASPLQWRGDKNALLFARLKISAVTAFKWEVGFIDAAADKTLGAVTDVDAPSNQFADGAVLSQETGETVTVTRLVTEGSDGQTIAATALGVPGGSDGGTTASDYTPTADTFFHTLIALNQDDAYAMIFDANMNPVRYARKNAALEEDVNMFFWFYLESLDTTTKVMTIDRIFAMQDR